ncbi:hypothetical protein WICPIJ_005200 [Wickerhamomyces pijperi]|uniref:Uncharacterized protein n=1 Tax=Wickerhamomyces pijperi TaxID=599730 RepID=A0A9P8TMK5_WICPI|nr:hypothetical protein WICPIJ_005200 [Wickerhamomyces pijperi]
MTMISGSIDLSISCTLVDLILDFSTPYFFFLPPLEPGPDTGSESTLNVDTILLSKLSSELPCPEALRCVSVLLLVAVQDLLGLPRRLDPSLEPGFTITRLTLELLSLTSFCFGSTALMDEEDLEEGMSPPRTFELWSNTEFSWSCISSSSSSSSSLSNFKAF